MRAGLSGTGVTSPGSPQFIETAPSVTGASRCEWVVMLGSRMMSLRLQCASKPGEVVVAVPDGVVFEEELTGERRVGVERNRHGRGELAVGECADRRGGD